MGIEVAIMRLLSIVALTTLACGGSGVEYSDAVPDASGPVTTGGGSSVATTQPATGGGFAIGGKRSTGGNNATGGSYAVATTSVSQSTGGNVPTGGSASNQINSATGGTLPVALTLRTACHNGVCCQYDSMNRSVGCDTASPWPECNGTVSPCDPSGTSYHCENGGSTVSCDSLRCKLIVSMKLVTIQIIPVSSSDDRVIVCCDASGDCGY